MKASILEFDHCFVINLEAEDSKETAKLARMAMNATKKLDFSETTFNANGTVKNRTRFGKRKNIKYVV